MLTMAMLPDLCCPSCPDAELSAVIEHQDKHRIIAGTLRCQACDAVFPVHAGVPCLFPTGLLADPAWQQWEAHLAGLQARRAWRVRHPEQALSRWGEKARPHGKFAQFTGIGAGRVLDVGCGPGKLRAHFGPQVEYYGLDPIVLPDVQDFPFVQALSEHLPFKSQTFAHVVAVAALDHFREPEAFFRAVLRVLKPHGKLHLVQSVHELHNPLAAVRLLGHWLKDRLEDRATGARHAAVPKHLTEFTAASLHQTLAPYFVIEALDRYSFRWYAPTKLLLTLTPKLAA